MYQTILFDLDGTLTDSGQGILNSVTYALDVMGIENPGNHVLKTFIGPPLQDSFQSIFQLSEQESCQAVTHYRHYFKKQGIFENQVYDGIPQLLENLKHSGKQMILATSKPEIFASQILEQFQLAHYFDFIGGASLDSSRQKKGDVIAYSLKNAGISDPSSAIMIGDRKHDIIGAKENQLAAIGVLYGYGNQAELEQAGAHFIAKTVSEIQNFLF